MGRTPESPMHGTCSTALACLPPRRPNRRRLSGRLTARTWLSAPLRPDRAHLPDVQRVQLRRAAFGEQRDPLTCTGGEDLVGDHALAAVGEDLDGGPVDQDAQADFAAAGGERCALHPGEVTVE